MGGLPWERACAAGRYGKGALGGCRRVVGTASQLKASFRWFTLR